jgi:uroporphyrinogen-III decarboxylase
LPISIYCVWQWWERHYQAAHGRPERIDFDWLDATYLGRQRQLNEWFGDLGIGQAEPALDTGFVSMLLPYHTMIVPVILGMPATIQDVGGYQNHPLDEAQIAKLTPVDLAESAVGELLVAEREKRVRRYGRATQMIDLASPANNGFSLRGTEFYLDLLDEPELARHYLETITETMIMAFSFIAKQFGKLESVPLGNCNVTMMSPDVYAEMIRPCDIRFIEQSAASQNVQPRCDLHHCNVPTEMFAGAYSALPGLRSLQGSVRSDIRAIRAAMPEVAFSGMINPVDLLNRPQAELLADIEHALEAGVNDLALWDVDPANAPENLAAFLRALAALARRHGREPNYSFIPITWEELDWEFPKYRGQVQR